MRHLVVIVSKVLLLDLVLLVEVVLLLLRWDLFVVQCSRDPLIWLVSKLVFKHFYIMIVLVIKAGILLLLLVEHLGISTLKRDALSIHMRLLLLNLGSPRSSCVLFLKTRIVTLLTQYMLLIILIHLLLLYYLQRLDCLFWLLDRLLVVSLLYLQTLILTLENLQLLLEMLGLSLTKVGIITLSGLPVFQPLSIP